MPEPQTPPLSSELPGSELKLLSLAQKRLLRFLVFGGVLVLAGSLYLAGITLWQDLTEPRVRLHAFYQGMLLFHFAAGTGVCALALAFAIWHLRAAWKRRRFSTVAGGTCAALGCAVLLVTGFDMLEQGNVEGSTSVFQIHRLAGVLALVAYVLHRRLAYTPTPKPVTRRVTASTAGLLFGALAIHGLLAFFAPPLPERAESAFAEIDITEDPFLPFVPLGSAREGSRFAPARTTTATGELINPALLAPGHAPSPEELERQVSERGFAAEHAIGAEDCRVCHPDVVAQWEDSAHRFSSFNNPFYTASIETLREERGPEAAKFCGGCHDPAVLLSGGFDGELDSDSLAAQTGLSCMACHGMHRIHDVTGNGNWEFADGMEDPYLFAGATEGWELWLRKYLIKARPRDHRRTLAKDFFSDSEYCATCHKVSLGVEINNYKWLRGQDEYDAWHASGVARNAAATFYLPPEAKSCQSCHMPLEAATRGDLAATDGLVRSHRFPSANTALPFVRGDQEMLEAAESEMSAERVRVDVLAIDHPRRGFVLDPASEALDLEAGDELIVYVVVRNLGVGHTFPGGTNDSNEGWLRFEARGARGESLALSGSLLEDG
ncbi:MAG: multiheme c-type cytochrome, partial [Planctomycetota bacterium]